jgi:DNA transformation protein
MTKTTPTRPRAGLADLPGLGPRSAAMLAAAGVRSAAQLRALGAVAAFARVRAAGARPSLNLLWALEGALSGLPWQQVAREHRTSLLHALEAHEAPASRR